VDFFFANSHLLFECCAEGLEIRFQKSDVPAHHAEMGNLFSPYPKIHCLDADTLVHGGLANCERRFPGEERQPCAAAGGGVFGEVFWTCLFVRHLWGFPSQIFAGAPKSNVARTLLEAPISRTQIDCTGAAKQWKAVLR